MQGATNVYDFVVNDLNGNPVPLSRYQGRVLLIVNTASKGDYKKQLQKLSRIQQVFATRPFSVLAFPCGHVSSNDFNSNEKIRRLYLTKQNYPFDVFGKVEVKGRNAHPLFRWLKTSSVSHPKSSSIHSMFNKFVVDADGFTVRRFKPGSKWSDLAWQIDDSIKRIMDTNSTSMDNLSEHLNTVDYSDSSSVNEDVSLSRSDSSSSVSSVSSSSSSLPSSPHLSNASEDQSTPIVRPTLEPTVVPQVGEAKIISQTVIVGEGDEQIVEKIN